MAVTSGILVLRALGLGDLLTAIPALRALRRAFDGERLVLAAPEKLRDIVELIDAVDELLPTAGLGELSWPGEPPRLAVNLHGRGPESIHDLLAQEPLELITYRHPDFPGVDGPDWPAEAHEVDRWCRLLEAARIPADRTDLALPPPPGPSPAAGAVVIHPGAAFAARRWPPDRYARVARALSGSHRVVVTGNAAEAPLAREIAEAAGLPAESVLAGDGLAELAATVAEARLVICGDTGVGHLATAYGTPSVLLFGPTPPRLWGPPPEARQHTVLWVGDVGDPHGEAPDPGLLLLREERVLAAAEGLLAAGASRG
ncbi:glycosyltransferase family 9 protein [Amycolatopsis roodepoortensis]|uniref:ADP-heptose:LPS heptosyltransferase n=1 Tax=Amycolatopsis roodepoortensis TaxID=700274 RepID=A0ABR9LBT5_9PSEU|nr:glycosyltransferase family 9 protein [Amycolatopsis roodepoortensis]MBE1577922.1 ADP-heptose:LPS heptosyltransferase [Amycolatopsis roodepoortensis]